MHNDNRGERAAIKSEWPKGEDTLVVSWSSITSGMHLGAYMGAKNIIMIGQDSGSINDKYWVDGYHHYNKSQDKLDFEIEKVKKFEQQSITVKEVLKELYGCNIHSLNPFINYNLEGHKYRGANKIN